MCRNIYNNFIYNIVYFLEDWWSKPAMNISHTDSEETETSVLPTFCLWIFLKCVTWMHFNNLTIFWMHFNLKAFLLFIAWFIRCSYYHLQITSLTLLHGSTLIICQHNCSCVHYCIFLSLLLKHVVVHSLLLK